jgi:hypothetical protein
MRVKTLSEELEFGGSGDPYIEVFRVPKAPPSYCTTRRAVTVIYIK